MENETILGKRSCCCSTENESISKKSRKEDFRFFDELPDDLVIAIAARLGATSDCPALLANFRLTCKRMNELGVNPLVLSVLHPKAFMCKAQNWCARAHKFLISCYQAGNLEAMYTLGMIWFYYREGMKNMRRAGLSLINKAADKQRHPAALYALSIIKFNGSGGSATDRRVGVGLTAKAASLGHTGALRELGLCIRDGLRIRKSGNEWRRILMQANARGFASLLPVTATSSIPATITLPPPKTVGIIKDPSHYHAVPAEDPHPANQFLADWFRIRGGPKGDGLRMCSNEWCKLPETRRNEFRKCSICGIVSYCSRACRAYDWKMKHGVECRNNAGDGEGSEDDDEELVEIEEVVDADE